MVCRFNVGALAYIENPNGSMANTIFVGHISFHRACMQCVLLMDGTLPDFADEKISRSSGVGGAAMWFGPTERQSQTQPNAKSNRRRRKACSHAHNGARSPESHCQQVEIRLRFLTAANCVFVNWKMNFTNAPRTERKYGIPFNLTFASFFLVQSSFLVCVCVCSAERELFDFFVFRWHWKGYQGDCGWYD